MTTLEQKSAEDVVTLVVEQRTNSFEESEASKKPVSQQTLESTDPGEDKDLADKVDELTNDFDKIYEEADALTTEGGDKADNNPRASTFTSSAIKRSRSSESEIKDKSDDDNMEDEPQQSSSKEQADDLEKSKANKKKKKPKKKKGKRPSEVNEFKQRKLAKEQRASALKDFLGGIDDTLVVPEREDDSISFLTLPVGVRDGPENKKMSSIQITEQLEKQSVGSINPMIATRNSGDEEDDAKHIGTEDLLAIAQKNRPKWETMSDTTDEVESILLKANQRNGSAIISVGNGEQMVTKEYDVEQGISGIADDAEQPSIPGQKKLSLAASLKNRTRTEIVKSSLAMTIICSMILVMLIVIGVIFTST